MARGEGVDRGGSGPGGGEGAAGGGGGSAGGVGNQGPSGLGNQAPGSGPRGGGGLTEQAPGSGPKGGTGTADQAPGSGPKGGGGRGDDQVRGAIQPGGTASEAAFGAFSEQTATVLGKLKQAIGLGPEIGDLAIAGAKAADPTAFSAGAKAGIGLEAAAAVSTLTANLPARATLAIVDRLTSVLANPAFSAGRASVESPTRGVADVAGAVAGIATGSIGVAKAVSLGLGLAGVAQAAQEAGFNTGGPGAPTPGRGGRDAESRTAEQVAQVTPTPGALIETSTSEVSASTPRALVTRENLGRQSLRIRRV